MPLKGVELEVSEGITEHSSRVALKGVFQNFGDVVACWVPPIDRRLQDRASVRFGSAESAEAAKNACDAGQVFLQGLPVKVEWRTGGGRRVGNSDLGELAGNNDRQPSQALAIQDRGSGRGGRGRSPYGGRSRRSRSRDRRDRSRARRALRDEDKGMPALPPAPEPFAAPAPAPTPIAGAFSGIATAQMLSAPPPTLAPPPVAAAPPPAPIPEVVQAIVDPVAEAKRKEELKAARAERAKQLKRGPGVAALVQGALKRAQTQPTVGKKEGESEKPEHKEDHKVPEKITADSDEEDDEAARKRSEEQAKAEEKRRKEKLEREAREREKAEREARERREQAKREAAEAEKALQKKEAETRDQRIKASVEAAKKQQAERAALKAQKEAESLYADMPGPNPEDAAVLNEAKIKEAVVREKANNLTNLPPEDKSKVVFLDVDGVLRPARAGGFDILATDGESAARVDTSDFFASALKALRHIIERTGAVVVLSSEWRRSEAMFNTLTEVFEKNRMRGAAASTITTLDLEPGADPVKSFAERRAREVSTWLRDHEETVSGWVVLDDINLSIADEARKPSTKLMGPRLVQTWPLCGLTMGNAKTAVRILNGEMINKVVVERPIAPGGGISNAPPKATA